MMVFASVLSILPIILAGDTIMLDGVEIGVVNVDIPRGRDHGII